MRFKVRTKVVCTNVHNGGDFDNGDVVEIVQIGCEDDPDCYGAISPHDGHLWYLYDDEVEAATNADHLQELSDEEKAHLLTQVFYQATQQSNAEQYILEWLRKPVEVEDEKAN